MGLLLLFLLGALAISADGVETVRVPFFIHVNDFALGRTPTLREESDLMQRFHCQSYYSIGKHWMSIQFFIKIAKST